MKSYKVSINDIIFYLVSIVFFAFIFFPNGILSQKEIIKYFILLVTLFLLSILNLKEMIAQNKKIMLAFFIELLLLLLSILSSNGGFGSVLVILLMSMILLQKGTIIISKKCFAVLLFVSAFSYVYLIYGINKTKLNTNYVAFKIFEIYLLIICLMRGTIKNKKMQIVSFISITVLQIFINFQYDCRSVLLAIIFIIFAYFVPISCLKKEKTCKTIWLMVTVGSIAFVILYIYLYNAGFTINFGSFSKKNLFSGREKIWSILLDKFKGKNIWLGIGSKEGVVDNLGAHNYMFSLLVLFGIPSFSIFIMILYSFFKYMLSNINYNNKICVLSIVAMFITAFSETTFIGMDDMTIALIIIIIYTYYNNQGGKNNECNCTHKKIYKS